MRKKFYKSCRIIEVIFGRIIKLIFQSILPGKKIFLFYTPVYPNMGDQAIRAGEIEFCRKYLSDYRIIEITERDWCRQAEFLIKKLVGKNIIILPGGGFLGDLWTKGEDDFKHIISVFSENKIIIFPQTCYFTDTERGINRRNENTKFYKKHKNVLFFLRDKRTLDILSEMVGKERCRYFPDIAMILNPDIAEKRREILFCIRNDKEQKQNIEEIDKTRTMLQRNGYKVRNTDTVVAVPSSYRRKQKERDKALYNKLKEFSGAKLVITDRLHGMILSAITSTPCIAMDNVSGKVSGVYEWIRKLDYVQIMNADEINIDTVRELISKKPEYDNSFLEPYFEEMADIIRKCVI